MGDGTGALGCPQSATIGRLGQISKCEYCGRGNRLSKYLNCEGCGAALPLSGSLAAPALVYSSEMLDAESVRRLGASNINIPVNVPPNGRLSEVVQNVASVGAVKFYRR